MADPYLTPEQIRERTGNALVNIDDEVLADLQAEFEEIAEDYLRVAYTPREATEVHHLGCERILKTYWPMVRSITSITVDLYGESNELDSSAWAPILSSGVIDLGGHYQGSATIVYEHGLDAWSDDDEPVSLLPKALLRADRLYVRACALRDESNVGRDVISQAFADGGTTRYSTPNKAEGRPTGYIDVDRLLNQVTFNFRGPVIA